MVSYFECVEVCRNVTCSNHVTHLIKLLTIGGVLAISLKPAFTLVGLSSESDSNVLRGAEVKKRVSNFIFSFKKDLSLSKCAPCK